MLRVLRLLQLNSFSRDASRGYATGHMPMVDSTLSEFIRFSIQNTRRRFLDSKVFSILRKHRLLHCSTTLHSTKVDRTELDAQSIATAYRNRAEPPCPSRFSGLCAYPVHAALLCCAQGSGAADTLSAVVRPSLRYNPWSSRKRVDEARIDILDGHLDGEENLQTRVRAGRGPQLGVTAVVQGLRR